ncbi:TPR-like protein [Phanerochaete sordida]|uniref:TPR-like protein n=1 Tax=Phanerochaete sordida TaxID=48140 RepID=A0A9P3G5U7_9APHY|nr:TPR-like protein [Phanerochaete sordida]
MGRTRTKSRKAQAAGAVPSSLTKPESAQQEPAIPALLEKAQTLIVQYDYGLAERFVRRILEREPSHAAAREMLGVIQLETGELDAAKQTFETLIPPHPDAPSPPPPSAHLYLAQLSDEDPQNALKHYQAAVDVMVGQLKGKERAVDSANASEDETEQKQNIVRALIAMVEIWMDPSYDLCFDPAAEKNCEELINMALQIDPGNSEALQALASVRLSQQREDDAKQCLEQAWTQWKDLEPDDQRLPPIPTRLALVKMFLELELFEPALLVLTGVMAFDDQEVEAWYLEGWCFCLMAERAQEAGGAFQELTWEQLARDARDCLDTCKMLHEAQEHPDAPLLEHVHELIGKLAAQGVQPSPEDDGDEDDEGGWEDEDDADVEMA